MNILSPALYEHERFKNLQRIDYEKAKAQMELLVVARACRGAELLGPGAQVRGLGLQRGAGEEHPRDAPAAPHRPAARGAVPRAGGPHPRDSPAARTSSPTSRACSTSSRRSWRRSASATATSGARRSPATADEMTSEDLIAEEDDGGHAVAHGLREALAADRVPGAEARWARQDGGDDEGGRFRHGPVRGEHARLPDAHHQQGPAVLAEGARDSVGGPHVARQGRS